MLEPSKKEKTLAALLWLEAAELLSVFDQGRPRVETIFFFFKGGGWGKRASVTQLTPQVEEIN